MNESTPSQPTIQRIYWISTRCLSRIGIHRRPNHSQQQAQGEGEGRIMIGRRCRSISRRAVSHVEPTLRAALAANVAESLRDHTEEWDLLEKEIEAAQQRLRESKEKEIFLGIRIYKYQKLLDVKAGIMKQQDLDLAKLEKENKENQQQLSRDRDESLAELESNKVEEGLVSAQMDRSMSEKRIEEWDRMNDLLTSIKETHKQILVECEIMRRKLRDLELRRTNVANLRKECEIFIGRANDLETKSEDIVEEDSNHAIAKADMCLSNSSLLLQQIDEEVVLSSSELESLVSA